MTKVNASGVVDDKTSATPVIDVMDSTLEDGLHFTVSSHVALSSSGTYSWMFSVPAATYPRINIDVEGALLTELAVYDNSGLTGNTGSTVTNYNLNRNSATTSSMTVHWGTSGATAAIGTKIIREKRGAAALPAKFKIPRLKLKPSTKYLVYVTAGANLDYVTLHADWYE